MESSARVGRARTAVRNFAINVITALVTTAICLAAVEIYLRRAGVLDVGNLGQGCHAFSDDPKLMYELKPHCDGTNAWGMRDPERELASDAFRIAAIGDSITFGATVDADVTYPRQLEAMIAADATLAPTEVLNLGVMGYSTVQEVETLRTKGLRFGPRVVILQYFLNDDQIYTVIFDEMIRNLHALQLDAYVGALDPARGRLWHWVATTRTYLGIQMLLARLGRHEAAGVASDEPANVNDNVITAYYKDKDPVRLGLLELQQIARDHGLEVLVVLFPEYSATPEEYAEESLKRQAEVMAQCQSLGFHCLDLIQQIRQSDDYRKVAGREFFMDTCCHETPRGYTIAAEIIFKELKRLGLLPTRSPDR